MEREAEEEERRQRLAWEEQGDARKIFDIWRTVVTYS